MPVQNAEVASMFDQTADLLEIQGGNEFRARAYRRAARTIEGLPHSAASMITANEKLTDLPGIGHDLAGKIEDICRTGRFSLLEELKNEMPGDLGAMAGLPGLGPKRIKLLLDELKVSTLQQLRTLVAKGGLRDVHGFGPAVEKKLIAALNKPADLKRYKLVTAEAEAASLLEHLSGLGRATIAGSFRRRRETVGDLDIVVCSTEPSRVSDRLTAYDNVAEILARGSTRITLLLRSGLQVDVRIVDDESYGAALMYFTGSKAHNIALRSIAATRGWKLNEYGLFSGSHRLAGATEQEVYARLGLPYIPPELREDRGEIEAAREGYLPRLIEMQDIRGDLHVHSEWTDGNASIAEMAKAARALGYEYMSLTDHSRRLAMTKGLDPARLAHQIAAIDKINKGMRGFTILKGIEVDVLKDGSLDLPDSALARLDWVVAGVHSFFDLPRDDQTRRIARAIANPFVCAIAHPTGRLIGERTAYDVDFGALLTAAHEHMCCLEINAQPDRLDLDDLHASAAKRAGVRLVLSSDAHSTASLRFMRFGIDQARRAWLTCEDVLNTRGLADLRTTLQRRRNTRSDLQSYMDPRSPPDKTRSGPERHRIANGERR